MSDVKLTQYSHGAGCGCKIAPSVLDKILEGQKQNAHFPGLLVGNDTSDDAAVHDLGDGRAVISTTDFFMPIVDDPADFGHIASVNAISDIYAMGGSPMMAIAILGWPLDKLGPEVAAEVIRGAREACDKAGIPLAGGHSIDAPEPIFGLSVTGIVETAHLRQNNMAKEGALLFLTKPLGVGILSTAQKKGIVASADLANARQSMMTLNNIGARLGKKDYVQSLTDVTGFGLLGHLIEMCKASGLSAEVYTSKVPFLPNLDTYLQQKAVPGGTARNWQSYGKHVGEISERHRQLLCDPQTSGGLLVAVDPACRSAFIEFMGNEGFDLQPIGQMVAKGSTLIEVKA